jgi:hypothetical protein
MISAFFASANVSQFAHVSLICGSGIAHVQAARRNGACAGTRDSAPATKIDGGVDCYKPVRILPYG